GAGVPSLTFIRSSGESWDEGCAPGAAVLPGARSLLALLLRALVQGVAALRRCGRRLAGGLLRSAPLLRGLRAQLPGPLELLLVGKLPAALAPDGLDADLRLGLRLRGDLLRRREVQRLQALPLALGVDALVALLLRVGAGGGGRTDDDGLLAEGPHVRGKPVDEHTDRKSTRLNSSHV